MKKIDVPWTMSSEEAKGIWKIWAKKGWVRGMSPLIEMWKELMVFRYR